MTHKIGKTGEKKDEAYHKSSNFDGDELSQLTVRGKKTTEVGSPWGGWHGRKFVTK